MFFFPLAFLKPVLALPAQKPRTYTASGDEFENYILFGQYFDSTNYDPLTIDSRVGEVYIPTPAVLESSIDYLESILFEYDLGSEDIDPLVVEDYNLNVASYKTNSGIVDNLEVLLFDPDDIEDNFGPF